MTHTQKITDLLLNYFLKNVYRIFKKQACLYEVETVFANFE